MVGLPFEYRIRGERLKNLDGQRLAQATEDRDRQLEDYLGAIKVVADLLDARVTALEP